MIWREAMDHVNDCYFCLTPSIKKGFNRKKSVIEYPNIPSAICPLPHSDELPIPEPREIDLLSSDYAESSEECSVSEPCTSRNKEFGITTEPHLIDESELHDLLRDLDLPNVKAELFASRLNSGICFKVVSKFVVFVHVNSLWSSFFSMKGGLVYCTDVYGIMQEFGYSHRPEEWRLFIDSSKLSLKAVLLHNKNMLPSIPVGYAAHVKENYKNITRTYNKFVGSVVEWLKHQACDQHGLSSKLTHVILLCPWERHFTAHSPAWWSWQAVLNYGHISIKLQVDSNILVFREAGRGNCLPYVLAPPSLSCKSGG